MHSEETETKIIKALEDTRARHGSAYRFDFEDDNDEPQTVVFRKPDEKELENYTAKIAKDNASVSLAQRRLAQDIVTFATGPGFNGLVKAFAGLPASIAQEAHRASMGMVLEAAKKYRPDSKKPAAS
jgi:hypothetical protein